MKKKGILLIIMLMVVGFAAVSTTLYINANTSINPNNNDFNVYYSNAYVNSVQDKSLIKSDTVIEFNTTFESVGEEYILDYEVTNGSKNYDAELEMICTSSSEYLTVTNKFDDDTILGSLKTRIGRLILEQTKSYTGEDLSVSIECVINANAVERTSLGILLEQELDIEAKDINNVELEAKAYKVSDSSKDELLSTLIESKNIEMGTSVRSIVEIQSDYIDELGSAVVYVDSIAQDEDNVVVVYNNKETQEWEYLGIKGVENGKIEFNNISRIPFAVINNDGSLGVKLQIVTFNSNSSIVEESLKTVIYNQVVGELPIVTRDGYTFDGWYTEKENGTKINENTIIDSDITFYAHWIANQYLVTYDANGGELSETSKTVTYDSTYGVLPTPTMVGYKFIGWYTEASGGSEIQSTTKFLITSDQTLYAHWEKDTYVVTYNANGGSVSTSSKTVTNGFTYGTLATPTRDGYTFTGWYTAASGGTKITEDTIVNLAEAQIIYAHWTLNYYTVTINNPGNGTTSVTSLSIPFGGTNSFTISPSDGYYLGAISCTNGYTVSGFVTGAKELPTQTVTVSNNSKAVSSTCTVTFSKLWASAEIKNVTSTGYDVYLYQAYNANGISKTSFPTWTKLAGQDDLLTDWPTNSSSEGTYLGDYTWKYHVNISAHNNEGGIYITHPYIHDSSGTRYYITNLSTTVSSSGYVNSLYLTEDAATFNKDKSYSLISDGTLISNNFTYEFYAQPSRAATLYDLGTNQASLTSSTLDWNYIIKEPYGGITAAGTASIGLVLGTNGAMAVAHTGAYYYIVLKYEADLSAKKKYRFGINNNVPYLYVNDTLVATGIEPPGSVTTLFTTGVIGDGAYGAYQGYVRDFVLYNIAR